MNNNGENAGAVTRMKTGEADWSRNGVEDMSFILEILILNLQKDDSRRWKSKTRAQE